MFILLFKKYWKNLKLPNATWKAKIELLCEEGIFMQCQECFSKSLQSEQTFFSVKCVSGSDE